jgi:hypothetical protein
VLSISKTIFSENPLWKKWFGWQVLLGFLWQMPKFFYKIDIGIFSHFTM